MLASVHGKVDVVRILIRAGADLNFQENLNGETALMMAARDDRLEIVEMLSEAGSNINHQNLSGHTALMKAAGDGKIEVIRMLIRFGANMDVQNKLGMTALMIAICFNKLEVVRLLVQYNDKINYQDKYGKTALMYAVIRGDLKMVQLLFQSNASVDSAQRCPEATLAGIRDNDGKNACDLGNDQIKSLIMNFTKINDLRFDKYGYFGIIPKDIYNLITNYILGNDNP